MDFKFENVFEEYLDDLCAAMNASNYDIENDGSLTCHLDDVSETFTGFNVKVGQYNQEKKSFRFSIKLVGSKASPGDYEFNYTYKEPKDALKEDFFDVMTNFLASMVTLSANIKEMKNCQSWYHNISEITFADTIAKILKHADDPDWEG